MDQFLQSVDSRIYQRAAELIWNAEKNGNRVHITGIGKPSHVANYISSLLSSTGTPTYFLHGTEAVHGSCGQLVPGDVVICISNSGETQELKTTVQAVKNNGCKVIAVTGNPDSWLAKEGDAFLPAGVAREGGPLNRAPRSSILAEIFVLQGLSIILQTAKGLTPQEYVKWHPGGTLGHLRENEKRGVRSMLKTDCIHPDIIRVLSQCGHGDKILIADGNYPLASKTGDAERVYLGLQQGSPTVTEVLEIISRTINVEKAEVMVPEGETPPIFAEFEKVLGGMKLDGLGRFEFYDVCNRQDVVFPFPPANKEPMPTSF